MPEQTDRKREQPVVLITGCSSGIGRGVARLFARRGFRVYATVRRESAAVELRDEAAAAGWALSTPLLDVTDEASVKEAVAKIADETAGRIDVLVNNAGRYIFGPVEQTRPEELRAAMETNVIGPLNLIRAVAPLMRARGQGAIVNISSLNGRNVLPVVGPYQASKFALEALTEQLRYELIPFGVRVTCIEPGTFATDLHRKESQTEESQDPQGPYAGLVQTYKRVLGAQKRAQLEPVLEAVYQAATASSPRLRWPVGPLSFLGGTLRPLVPDRVYEWVMRFRFRLPPFR